jgi:hypothetical protein
MAWTMLARADYDRSTYATPYAKATEVRKATADRLPTLPLRFLF